MAKRVIREDTISHERWMVSYADFLTLLLAFFVVMYSVSQRNEDQFRVLSHTLSEAFNLPASRVERPTAGEPVTAVMPGIVPEAIESPERQRGSGRVEEEEPRSTTSEPQLPEEFRRISQRVEERFAELVERRLVSVQGNEEWLEIELKSSLLFASGEAVAGAGAREIIRQMADVLRDSALPLRVEGFTDDRPIATSVYPSNWELSSARAATIVKLLTEFAVDPARLAAVGYGEFQPVADNSTEAGRAANRRVVLMLSRNAQLRPQLPRAQVQSGQAMPAEPVSAAPAGAGVVRVELDDGGILYTNDPARAAVAPGAGSGPATGAGQTRD